MKNPRTILLTSLITSLLALASLGGCNTVVIECRVIYPCLNIKGGQLTANCDTSTVELTELCVSLAEDCGELERFTLCLWIDANDDGKKQDEELIKSVDDKRPGREVKVEACSAPFPPGSGEGDKVYMDTAIYVKGMSTPRHSKRRCSKIQS